MANKGEHNCKRCLVVLPFRKLKRIKKNGEKIYLCPRCYSINRKSFRKECKETIPIIVRVIEEKKPEKQRGYIPMRYKTEEEKEKLKARKAKLGFYLTYDESKFLWKKYFREGNSPVECSKLVKKIKANLNALVKKLKSEKVEHESINKEFKEAFRKLVDE